MTTRLRCSGHTFAASMLVLPIWLAMWSPAMGNFQKTNQHTEEDEEMHPWWVTDFSLITPQQAGHFNALMGLYTALGCAM